MKGRGDFLRLERIWDQCGILLKDLGGETLATFSENRVLYDATVMRLFTIGEDAANLSEETRSLVCCPLNNRTIHSSTSLVDFA